MNTGGLFLHKQLRWNKNLKGLLAGVATLLFVCGAALPLASAPSLWIYDPPHFGYLAARTSPETKAPAGGGVLTPGEIITVQNVKDSGDSTFLELVDGRGWVMATSNELGQLCRPHTGPTLWRFQPPEHRPLDLRSAPKADAERTGHRLLPGEVFRCSHEVVAGEQRFLELDNGKGWAFEKAPGSITLCQRQQCFRTAKVAKEARPWIPRDWLEPPVVTSPSALKRVPVESLCLGQRLTGYVSSIDEGVFVDVGAEAEGWVHPASLSDDYVADPAEAFGIGDEVQTMVTSIIANPKRRGPRGLRGAGAGLKGLVPLPSDMATSRLYLSIAKPQLRPVAPKEPKPQVGTRMPGLVSCVKDFGIHVVLGTAQGGLAHEGFLHVSKMAGHVASVKEAFKVGDKVKVKVIGASGRNLELSTMGLEDLSRSNWFEAKVYNIKPFGIFVEVTESESSGAGTQGMVHISEIKKGHVANIYDEVEIGDVVQVRVLSQEAGRVKFTMLPE